MGGRKEGPPWHRDPVERARLATYYEDQDEAFRQRRRLKESREKGYRDGMISGLLLGGVAVGSFFDAVKTGNVLVSLAVIFVAPAIITWIVWKVLSLLVKVLTLGRRSWSELVRPLDRVLFRIYTQPKPKFSSDLPVMDKEAVPTAVLVYIVFVVWILLDGDPWAPAFT
jgi:hypothetical protein